MRPWVRLYRTAEGQREIRFGLGIIQGGMLLPRLGLVLWKHYEPLFSWRWFGRAF